MNRLLVLAAATLSAGVLGLAPAAGVGALPGVAVAQAQAPAPTDPTGADDTAAGGLDQTEPADGAVDATD